MGWAVRFAYFGRCVRLRRQFSRTYFALIRLLVFFSSRTPFKFGFHLLERKAIYRALLLRAQLLVDNLSDLLAVRVVCRHGWLPFYGKRFLYHDFFSPQEVGRHLAVLGRIGGIRWRVKVVKSQDGIVLDFVFGLLDRGGACAVDRRNSWMRPLHRIPRSLRGLPNAINHIINVRVWSSRLHVERPNVVEAVVQGLSVNRLPPSCPARGFLRVAVRYFLAYFSRAVCQFEFFILYFWTGLIELDLFELIVY